jgi:hypothetical protein
MADAATATTVAAAAVLLLEQQLLPLVDMPAQLLEALSLSLQ